MFAVLILVSGAKAVAAAFLTGAACLVLGAAGGYAFRGKIHGGIAAAGAAAAGAAQKAAGAVDSAAKKV